MVEHVGYMASVISRVIDDMKQNVAHLDVRRSSLAKPGRSYFRTRKLH
jgi:hypothetical protein